MIKFIARLIRPIVEEAIAQIYARRGAQADADGISGLDRVFFKVLGGEPEREAPSRKSTHRWGGVHVGGDLDPAEVARAMDKAVRSGMYPH